MKIGRWLGGLALGVMVCSGAPTARACTRPMPMAEMADHAAEVWTVRVDGSRSFWADEPRRIETEVTLVIDEALKGQRGRGERFTLIVPGGRVGEWEMRLCCAPNFEVGKAYVMFVLPEYRTYPTVGMSRGVFELVTDGAGVQRVLSVDGDAVIEIGVDGLPVLARGRNAAAPRASLGVRVVDVPAHQVVERAITYEAFKAALAPVLVKSRAHAPNGPLAQRVQADYGAVAMVAANDERNAQAPARVEQAQEPIATAPPRVGGTGGQP